MARLLATLFVVTSSSFVPGALAAEPSSSPWRADTKVQANRNFDLPDERSATRAAKGWESRLFAGRQVMPNGTFGIGMFGPKAEKGPHSAATARDLSMPKQRKAAVGFSLKF